MTGELWVLKGSNQILEEVHPKGTCRGVWCTIHNPMPGPWNEWPMQFVANMFMVRVCPHGIVHPAIEDVLLGRMFRAHSCDGCPCMPEEWREGDGE